MTAPPPIATGGRDVNEAIAELAQRDQWAVYQANGRPYTPGGMPVSVTKPFYRSGFDECWRAAFVDGTAEGLSFILLPRDPYLAFDLDEVIAEDGTLHSKARELVRALNTYTEISPSGRGLRIFCKVNHPPEPGGRGRKAAWAEGYWQGKALRMTGNTLPGAPEKIKWIAQRTIEQVWTALFPPRKAGGREDDGAIEWPDWELVTAAHTFDQLPEALRTKFKVALEADAKLRTRWQGSTEGLKDTSGSARDLSLAHYLRRQGFTLDEYASVAWTWEHGKAEPDARHYARCWARTAPAESPKAKPKRAQVDVETLAERVEADPGAAFEPEALDFMKHLRASDPAAYHRARARLKAAGVRVGALEDEIERRPGEAAATRRKKQADILVALASEALLFHAPDRTGYADVNVSGHRETWPIRSKGFRRWLTCRYFEESQGAPNSEALQSALNVIEARAHFDAPEREVHVRVAGLKGRLYLDLADDQWRAIEIGQSGWRIVAEPPVRFRRAAGMLALPIPTKGGSVETLRSFLNVRRNHDFVLVVAWALAVLRNCGPYPVLVLAGEQGSAKSTLAAILRTLLDPNSAPLRALPREDRDLFIAATNGHMLAFDNVSGLPSWISDTLCRLATGGGFAVRQLYTDQDEVLFDATRPVILNGIEDVVTRSDLADRAIFLTLEPIPDDQRRPQKELWAAFDRERPQILGALLDAVVHGLRRLPKTSLDRLPRMADFALWATACETALWDSGAFLVAYGDNRAEAVDTVIDADPVATAVRSLMTVRTVWTGTASDLLGALDQVAGEMVRKVKTWPGTPRALSGRLRRAAPFLRKIGIEISFDREGRSRTRTITISEAADGAGAQPSASSARSAAENSSDLGADGRRTNGPGADANPHAADGGADSTVRGDAAETVGADGADGADAKSLHGSGAGRQGAWSARL